MCQESRRGARMILGGNAQDTKYLSYVQFVVVTIWCICLVDARMHPNPPRHPSLNWPILLQFPVF